MNIIAAMALALLIPPALPNYPVPVVDPDPQATADQGKLLMDRYFEVMSEGEAFDLDSLFSADARFVERDGESFAIRDQLDDEGFPMMAQWMPITTALMTNGWAAIVETRNDQGWTHEAILKFAFERNASGTLRISSIEQVGL
jgi:hypothetical protein